MVVVAATSVLRLTQLACCDLLNHNKPPCKVVFLGLATNALNVRNNNNNNKKNNTYAIIRTFPGKDINSMKSSNFPGKIH